MISLLLATLLQPGTVIQGGIVYDGSGEPGYRADIRIEGDTIVKVGKVTPRKGDRIVRAVGLAVSPGFIDAHSHADGGIFENPDAETQIRQGITTAIVGEDGGSAFPLKDFWAKLAQHPAALNFASFVGEGTIRSKVMGDVSRNPSAVEMTKMKALVAQEMRSGALGLSTGLEYQPGRYASTRELIDLAKVSARRGGLYISHVRNEDNQAFEAFHELVQISKGARMPAEINHIKLCSARVWGRAGEVLSMMAKNKVTADVYPYTYWHSTIRVIIPTEDFGNRALWEQGLKDVGGPAHVLLSSFSPDPTWAGKTIEQLAKEQGKDVITLIQEIIERCYGKGQSGREGVIVTAMSEADVTAFVRSPIVMFCSDGGLQDTHPRGAGSFPRILGQYVRAWRTLPLPEAIRKMTSLPAWRFGLKDRGTIAVGKKADIVLFDPAKIEDTATVEHPTSKPNGLPTVLVNGQVVLENGESTKRRPGRGLPRLMKFRRPHLVSMPPLGP